MNLQIQLILIFLGTYFLGSIPFSLIISRIRGVDLRKIGSGNLGATNIYRALNFRSALLVFFLDAAKGFAPTFLMIKFFPLDSIFHVLVGFTAIAGHSLSVFVRFRGGKGAATGLGVLMALSPLICIGSFVFGIIVIAITRYVSLGTIITSIVVPVALYFFNYPLEYVIFIAIIALFIIIRHHQNIRRLLKGEEKQSVTIPGK